MKILFSIVTAVLVLAVGGCAPQVDVEAERAAIRKFHDECMTSLQAGNVDCFAEDGQMLPLDAAPIKGRDAVGELVSQFIKDPNFSVSHNIVNAEVSRSGDQAYIHYAYEITMSDHDGNPVAEQGKAIWILKKQPQVGWKILIDTWKADGESMSDALVKTEQMTAQAQVEEQNKEVVERYWNGKWNERRPEILDELQTPDVAYHGTAMNMNGIEEYKQVYSSFLSAFHDTQITVDELIAEGDKVMSRVSVSGTHKGDFDGLPPTEKVFTISLFTVFRLDNGKIAEEWEVVDELGLMHQLGMELGPKEDEK